MRRVLLCCLAAFVTLIIAGCAGEEPQTTTGVQYVFAGKSSTSGTSDIFIASGSGVAAAVPQELSLAGDQLHPSLSWDRKEAVFESRASGKGVIMLMTLPGGTPEALTSGTYDDTEPALSPDGKSVVFSREESGGKDLFVLGIDDRSLRRVTDMSGDEVDPTWSADGRAIYFANNSTGSYHIYRQSFYSTAPTQITSASGDQRYPTLRGTANIENIPPVPPATEPIVYAGNGTGTWQLYYKDGTKPDSTPVQLTSDTSNDTEPTWVHAGNMNTVMYVVETSAGATHLATRLISPLTAPYLLSGDDQYDPSTPSF